MFVQEKKFADEVGVVLGQMGMPPAFGRLLGWLLICDPPAQTSTQLSEALGLSKGSVSTGMRMLERAGLVHRVPMPGRGHAYEMAAEGLVRATDPATRFGMLRDVMSRGLAVLEDPDSERARRLRVTRDFYAFAAQRIPELMEEFRNTYLGRD
jgi:DNA-binding transcriptional regulator GbsR (MarR family)